MPVPFFVEQLLQRRQSRVNYLVVTAAIAIVEVRAALLAEAQAIGATENLDWPAEQAQLAHQRREVDHTVLADVVLAGRGALGRPGGGQLTRGAGRLAGETDTLRVQLRGDPPRLTGRGAVGEPADHFGERQGVERQ